MGSSAAEAAEATAASSSPAHPSATSSFSSSSLVSTAFAHPSITCNYIICRANTDQGVLMIFTQPRLTVCPFLLIPLCEVANVNKYLLADPRAGQDQQQQQRQLGQQMNNVKWQTEEEEEVEEQQTPSTNNDDENKIRITRIALGIPLSLTLFLSLASCC